MEEVHPAAPDSSTPGSDPRQPPRSAAKPGSGCPGHLPSTRGFIPVEARRPDAIASGAEICVDAAALSRLLLARRSASAVWCETRGAAGALEPLMNDPREAAAPARGAREGAGVGADLISPAARPAAVTRRPRGESGGTSSTRRCRPAAAGGAARKKGAAKAKLAKGLRTAQAAVARRPPRWSGGAALAKENGDTS